MLFRSIKEAFLEFIEKLPFYGAAVVCLDDANVAASLPRIRKRVITYGLTSQAEVHARTVVPQGLTSTFELCRNNEVLGEITLNIPGQHNVYNALAAITVALELDIPFEVIRAALRTFSGVQRRLQIKGEVGGVMVIDDYGHHPTEIRATLAAMRSAWPKRRLIVMFQPHRYTRTAGLFKEFSTAFHDADILLLTEIYAASETPIAGVSGSALLEEIKLHGQKNAYFVAEVESLPNAVLGVAQPDDIVLTLGAGNIYHAGEELLRQMKQGHAVG